MIHRQVLLKEILEIFDPKPGQLFIDGTANGGGHTFAILDKIKPNGKILAIDKDRDLIESLRLDARNHMPNMISACGNYGEMARIAKEHGFHQASGILLDLGYSSWHIESSGRGFSFLRDEPLVMRYETEANLGTGLTASDVVNRFSEKDLADILLKYGEERFARKIAKEIAHFREKQKIISSRQLADIVYRACSRKGYFKIHPATRTFQALRIFVNDELGELERALPQAVDLLSEGGKLAIITFHSLEDRIVKNFFRQCAKEDKAEILTKKPIYPTEEEIAKNPRARSAKLRVVQKMSNI